MAQLNLRKEIIVFAPLLLPRVGLRLRAQENESFIAASGASFSSGKSNGVVAANVSCNGHDHWKDVLLVVGGAFGLGFGCRCFQ